MNNSMNIDGPSTEMQVREAIRDGVREEMESDKQVFVQGIDVANEEGGPMGVNEGLAEEFGEDRVRNTPISESAIVGSALGASLTGMRPVVEIMVSAFMGVPYDQILNNVSKTKQKFGGMYENVPITIRTQNTMGFSAGPQHTQANHHLFTGIPGIRTVCVSTPYDAKGLIKSAIRCDDPVLVFEHWDILGRTGPVPDGEYTLPIDEAAVERPGEDLTVVATQRHLWNAFEAAEQVGDEVDVEIVSPRAMSPLDVDTIAESAQKTGRVIVVDDTPQQMGTQSDIATELTEEAFFDLDYPVQRIGPDNISIPYSPPLENEVMTQSADIVDAIERLA
jgi:pyruvate dehydrogenase E1 component beta subunit